jgi:aspartate/methionine/tyrosine aminotransferase
MEFASRLARLGTETAFEVLARAREIEKTGRSVVHLEIGEPDFDTPAHIVEAAVDALRKGWTHYGPSAGLPELRETIAAVIAAEGRYPGAKAENVVVTPGGKPVLFFAVLAAAEEGSEVIYPNPGFPIYESAIDFVGAKAVPLPLLEQKGFRFDLGDLEARLSPKTRMLILNSPANPTGGVLTRADLEGIADLVRGKPIWVLSDEIYSKILYSGTHVSIASLPGMAEQTCVLDGFSKTYAMTGWRMGYGVMPKALAAHMTRLMTNVNSCTASFTQVAGIAALRGPAEPVLGMVREFRARRDRIVAGLNAIPGVSCVNPDGAFYVFPNTSALSIPSAELARRILDESGVAVLSGTAFGKHGEGYLRLSYANSIPNIEEALRRIGDFVRSLAARV